MLQPYNAAQEGYVGTYADKMEIRHWKQVAEALDARVTELEQQLASTQEALQLAHEWRDYHG